MDIEGAEQARKQVAEIRSRGPWLATSSGRAWSIRDPRPEDVRIEDIIGGLGRTCRWSGQLHEDVEFYSVAEHSTVMTVYAVETGIARTREDALMVLIHDGLEAPYFDAATPVKDEIPGIRQFEHRGEAAIQAAFDCVPENLSITKAQIKELDKRIRIDERQQIIADPAKEFSLEDSWDNDPGLEPLGVRLKCMTPFAAMQDFAETFLWVIETLPRVATGPDHVLDQAQRIAPKYLPYRDLVPYSEPEEAAPGM
jgi:5'-deoxynucleotidase YfbR-like HD superfamily hydrolase